MPTELGPQKWKVVKSKDSKYAIEEMIKEPSPHPFDSPFTISVYMLSWSLWATYLTLRYQSLSASGPASVGWLQWLMLIAEFLILLPEILNAVPMALYMFFGTKGKHRASYRLAGGAAPDIDVCITCCGETIDVIMDTVSGAATQDYPAQHFRVFVLDDAKSTKLENAIETYNKRYSKSVKYLARTKLATESQLYKAGNLRFGLSKTSEFGQGSEYFASLDVDMIPEQDWLRRIVPHLILDKTLALVSPAGWHYNLPSKDLLGQAGPAAVEIFEPMNDNIGCSHCFGSGFVLRRAALDEIGGWPKVPVGEDIYCSYTLTGYGWGIAFVKEFVQYGLTAGSFDALVKQRKRWTDGDLLLRKGPALDPTLRRTVPQRISAIAKMFRLFTSVTDCLCMMILPLIVWTITTSKTEKVGMEDNAHRLRALFLATFVASKLNYALIYAKVGRQTESRFWAAPYSTFRIFRSILPTAVVDFTATGTVISAANERSEQKRQRLPHRLLTPTMFKYSAYTLFAFGSFTVFLYVKLWSQWKQTEALQAYACTGALVRLLECVFKVSVPLRYMTFPPSVPERRELMEQDELGVFRPKRRYENIRSSRFTWLDVFQLATILAVDWNALSIIR